jgi:hypothetical protein
VKKKLDIKLQRGVLISGKVAEQGTGRPLARLKGIMFPHDTGSRKQRNDQNQHDPERI